MDPLIIDFARDVAEHLPVEGPVLEVGSRPAEGQEQIGNVRSLFPGVAYTGIDIQEGPNVDEVQDVHALTFPDETFGTVFCLETLEHVFDPHRAMAEMRRVLKPGGMIVMSSPGPFFFIHAHPWDFWRFTPEGFAQLLKDFETSWTAGYGYPPMPQHVFGLGVKGPADAFALEQLPRLHGWITDWGDGEPVDLGPIRMTTRKLLALAARESGAAVRRKLRGR